MQNHHTKYCWRDKHFCNYLIFSTEQRWKLEINPPKDSHMHNTYKISGKTRFKKGRKNKNGSTDNLSQAIFASTVIGLILPIASSLKSKRQVSIILALLLAQM